VLGNIFMNATNGPKRQTSDSNWVLCLQPHLLVVIHSRRPAHFLVSALLSSPSSTADHTEPEFKIFSAVI
jgi:hypothetical protein